LLHCINRAQVFALSLGVGRASRQPVYDLSFVNVDNLDTVQAG